MPYFEDVELGDEIGPLQTEATDYGVLEFCQVWDNRGPSRFTDQAMAEESRLPGPIVPGIMSMGIMARLLTDWAGSAEGPGHCFPPAGPTPQTADDRRHGYRHAPGGR